MIKFKAAILEKQNSLLNFTDIFFKGELKKGQILVKLKYTGICGKQIDEISINIDNYRKWTKNYLEIIKSGKEIIPLKYKTINP